MRQVRRGGVGVRLPFPLAAAIRPLRENRWPVQVRTFLFLTLAERSGEVFGRAVGDGLAGANAGNAEIGSVFSVLGVVFGEHSFEWLNQKCFFLLEGLVDAVARPPNPEADTGRFRGLSSSTYFLTKLTGLGLAASAVLGRRLGLSSSLLRTKDGIDCVGGLAAAKELTLPVNECVPRIVEVLPSVSEEIRDSGLGMTSTRSENPTRGRTPGALSRRRRGELVIGSAAELDVDCRCLRLSSIRKTGASAVSAGVEGAEPALCLDTAFALIRSEASMPEIDTASDRRCRCLPGPDPVTGGPCALESSDLLGLVLTIVAEER